MKKVAPYILSLSLLFAGTSGCTKKDTTCLQWTFYIPNSFKPNNDGIDNTFIAKGTGIASYEMWIFDKWGNAIYHCTDINNPWDGKVQGSSGDICQEGTYTYLIKATDACGNAHTYIGNVTLLK